MVSYKINRVLLLSLMLMLHANSFAQSSDKNYVQTKTFLDESGSAFMRHIDYYDELGFVSETVDVGCNTSETPIAARTEYNVRLKPLRQWLPVPSAGLDYLGNVNSLALSTYDTGLPYSENEYDDFQNLKRNWKPGDAWEERPVTLTRGVVPSGVVKRYSVGSDGSLQVNGTYPYGLLMSITTTDEDGRSMTVYADMHENTILERRGTGMDATDTYFVYDNYGHLRYVLPPMCQQCGTSELSKYWYKYTYDDRGRCTEKQLPGCEPVRYWYDAASRIQSEQDGHLRSQSLYRNYGYDGIGRLTLQTIGPAHGDAGSTNAVATEVRNFYDNYSCCQELAYLIPTWSDSINTFNQSTSVTKGRLTATLCYTSNNYKYLEMYRYDAAGRVCYKLIAYADKWMKTVHAAYNFTGDVTSTEERVYTYVNGGIAFLTGRRTINTYHPGTRLLSMTAVTHTDRSEEHTSELQSR